MDPINEGIAFDVPKLHETLIIKYRQRLDMATFELERALAQSEQKDVRIAELHAQIAKLRAPKPGPR